MENCIKHSKLQQYADDSQLYMSFTTEYTRIARARLEEDLEFINSYAEDHNLKLNAIKSCIILFGSNKNNLAYVTDNFNITINNTPLPVVNETKNLGVYFDSGLTFLTHIKNKLKIAYMRLKKLYNFKNYLLPSAKYYLCNALVLSLFDYGDIIYGDSLSSRNSNTVQKVQNSCMRFSFNIPFRNHITPYLNVNLILNMKNRRKRHMYSFVYKILKKYLRNYFTSSVHSHKYQ